MDREWLQMTRDGNYYENLAIAVASRRPHISWTAMAEDTMTVSHSQTTLKWRLIWKETREKDANALPHECCSTFHLKQF